MWSGARQVEKRISSSATAESAARKWIDTLDGRSQWRIEVLSRRVRRRSDGKALPGRKELPLRIRRFAEGCPPAQMRAAMDYLLAKAPYSDIVLNGERLPGSYRPTLTEWRRDRGNVVHGPSRDASDATYTLVQDLVDASMDDALPLGTMSNCTQEESTEWTWDAGFVRDLPEPEQGVTWSIQGVRRNEDGTIDYALVKRRAITQHTPRTASKDDAVVKVETESWTNLYGSSDEGFRDHTGAPVPVPEAGPGVEVEMRESDDCTYSVRATYSSPKAVATDRSSSHTIYEGKHSGTGRGEHAPLPNAPDASGGVIYGHDSSMQPDGTYVNKTDVTVERPVSDAVVTVTKGRRGTRTEMESRNQPTAAGMSVGVGGMVRVEKTPGGLYNNVIRTWSKAARLLVGEACRKTEFQHVHAETRAGIASIPTSTSHVIRSKGTTVRRTTDMDDEGSITQTTETTTEIHVPKHVESWTVGLTGLVHMVKSASAVTAGAKPRYSKDTIGSSVKNTFTEGGRYDVEVVEVDRTGSKVGIETGCRATVFEHRDTTATADPRGDMPERHVTAGGGKTRETETRLRDDGTAVTTDTVTDELPQPNAVKRVHKTAKALVTTVTDRNVAATAGTPSVGGIEEHVMTDGGLYNHTVTTTVPTGAKDYEASRNDAFESSRTVQTTGTGQPSAPLGPTGGGVHTKTVSTMDENGIVSTNVETVTEKPVVLRETGRRDRHVAETVRTVRGSNGGRGLTCTGDHWSSSLTQGGLQDSETVDRDLVDRSPDSFSSEEDLFSSTCVTQTINGIDSPVGNERAEAPSAGTMHEVREVRDETGVVSKYDTEVREKNVAHASRRTTSTHFTKTKIDAERSSLSDPYEEKEFVEPGQDIVTVEVNRTKGDAYDVTTTTVTPKERIWEEPVVEYTRLYRRAKHFRNCTQSVAENVIIDVVDDFKRKLDNWFAKDEGARAPTSYDVQPTMTLNDFGLYDGGVIVHARWPNESAGTDGDATWQFIMFGYWEVAVTEKSSLMPNGKLHVTRMVMKRKHEYKNGRGTDSFMNFMNDREVFQGSNFSFVPSTGTYHYDLVTEIQEAKKDKVYDS